jgi:ADP-ribose pyrophosphatase
MTTRVDSSKERPAEVLGTRTVYEGRAFSVTADQVRLPNGRDVQIDVVRHVPSVVLLPMPDPQHVILIRQYRHAVGRWLWEAPAGCVDPGESPEDAARRECHEEVGLVPGRIIPLGTFLPTPGFCDEVMNFYRLEELRVPEAEAEADPDEMILPQTVEFGEALTMIVRGDIEDMKTVTALLLASTSAPR